MTNFNFYLSRKIFAYPPLLKIISQNSRLVVFFFKHSSLLVCMVSEKSDVILILFLYRKGIFFSLASFRILSLIFL